MIAISGKRTSKPIWQSFLFAALGLFLLAVAGTATADHCKGKHKDWPGCDGGGGDNDSGQSIALNCDLVGGPPEFTDSINGDDLGPYRDGDDKVGCGTGGTTQPNLSGLRLSSLSKGNPDRAFRKIDLSFGAFTAFQYDADNQTYQLIPGADPESVGLPASMFKAFDNPRQMETVGLAARPYMSQGHIQGQVPGTPLEMALRIRTQPYDEYRFIVSLADTYVTGNYKWEGLNCLANYELQNGEVFDSTVIAAASDDVTVYRWPAGNGWTVTTGAVIGDEPEGGYTLEDPPDVTEASRSAAICSPDGLRGCDGADDSGPCNFLGYTDVTFTWHAEYQ